MKKLPPQVDLPALEQAVLARWESDDVFARSLAQTADGDPWVFYEGPPTANGKPGTHHVEARTFKDLFPRFKTMQGRHVPRKAGWDCHGLPVELAVEKELGFSGKQDIEAYGIAAFNAKCRESVLRHVDAFEQMTRRMGYWVDTADAYATMDPRYIESVWWSLQQIHAKGLLVEDHRVAPYCPRCGTGLSDHEVAQGYQDVVDPSVYVRFPVTSGDWAGQASLLVWTTTPWTLVSNTAVAVNPEVTYVVARRSSGSGTELLVVAEPLAQAVLGEHEVVASLPGTALEHLTYERPFDWLEFPSKAHYVGLASYVTVESGTGLVHQAPAFGAEDLQVARQYGLPVVNPIRPDGTFEPDVPLVGGVFFKKADRALTDDLASRGLLFLEKAYEHPYPHCWRCDTALLYYALPSWYIRTTSVKERLLQENAKTDWHPQTIRDGRYGDWLENNIDWALSRNRYWGTPLPIWRCESGHLTVVGSLKELSTLSGTDQSQLDPHRPYIDAVTLPCPECGLLATRVPEVIDCWYDAGSMPFAQVGYPHSGVQPAYPAQFIAEAIDQTRGWFYTLMAIGTLVFDQSSYEAVLCLGHILDTEGRKMSKHLGNVLDPMVLMDKHGADALRWFMLCSGSPWAARRIGDAQLEEVVRKVLLTYWNTASFLTLYADANDWNPGATGDLTLMDRWALSETQAAVTAVTASLEEFDLARAGRRLTALVDDLSNWYVRTSRRRFWEGDPAALSTLHDCLRSVTLLLAPFVPFVTDEVWAGVFTGEGAPDSVHLAAWPTGDEDLVDAALAEQMVLVRRLVDLGRTARAESRSKTRQPLARALVSAQGWDELPDALRDLVAAELNVVALERLSGDLVDVTVKANFRPLGKRFGKGVQAIAVAVAAADPVALAAAVRAGTATVEVDGETVALGPDEVVVTETPREGWAVASGVGVTVGLDLTLTPELRRAGTVRDVVRLVQDARKSTGLEVTDRIELWWDADGETAEALLEGADRLADEVLATGLERGAPVAPLQLHEDAEVGVRFWLRAAGA